MNSISIPATLRGACATALLTLAASGTALAQTPPPAAGGPSPAQIEKFQKKVTELRGIHQQLEGLRTRAMTDPALKKKVDAFQKAIEKAMVKKDPTIKKDLTRFETLKKQAEAANAKKDVATLKKLGPELEGLAMKLGMAHQKVSGEGPLLAEGKKLQTAIMAAMSKLDPKADALMKKADALTAELQAMRPPGPPPGARPPPPPAKK